MKHGLPPILWPHARILVLGSLPGDESLRRQEYYGHPHNTFWAILEHIFGEEVGGAYADKLRFLEAHGIALWDVLERAERRGSLDKNIRNGVPNDFDALFARLPALGVIALNGRDAQKSSQRVQARYSARLTTVRILSMPSTSPAHASLSVAEKAELWRAITLP